MVTELQRGDPPQIGPYQLVGRLGHGTMGQVFLGLSAGEQPVAVKVIRAELAADPQFQMRLSRELAVVRRVSGSFTVMFVDWDVDGPVPWFATAYVAGPSLSEAVSGYGPLPMRSVLALARGLAEGLATIHAAGVVHRDLKPSNVLLAQDGPRVVDFGISRALGSTLLTQAGLPVSSPGFKSPEQAVGREAGPPGDIFSLGAVVAFAATGQGPFGTGTTAALLDRVVGGSPSLDRVPAEVRPLVERCLAKDPAQRPTTDSLLAELGAITPAADWLPESVTRAFAADTTTDGTPASPWEPPSSSRGPSEGNPLTVPPGRLPRAAGVVDRPSGPGGRRSPQHRRWRPLLAWAVGGLLAVSAAAGLVRNVADGNSADGRVHSPRPAHASPPTASTSARPATSSAPASGSPSVSPSPVASSSPIASATTSPAASQSATTGASASPSPFPFPALPPLPPPPPFPGQ